MADKQYIVKTTVHGIEKAGGKKVVLLSGPKPQDVPAGLVKELLSSGAIVDPSEGEATDAPVAKPAGKKTAAKPKTAPAAPPAPDDGDGDGDAEDEDEDQDEDGGGSGDNGSGD